jgi:hypothetical protein
MLNHAGEILLALVIVLSAFLSYWLVWSLGPGRPLRTGTISTARGKDGTVGL